MMSYDQFVSAHGPDGALAMLDTADLLSLKERGYPLRRWAVMLGGRVPDNDDFSDSDDPFIRDAIRSYGSGERTPVLTGMGFEDVMLATSGLIPGWAERSARECYGSEPFFGPMTEH